MRYNVEYLASGERQTTDVEADDAAAAVAAVQAEHSSDGFELLAVVLDAVDPIPTDTEAIEGGVSGTA